MIENDALWDLSQNNIRKPSWVLQMAFEKQLDPDIDFLVYDSEMNYDSGYIYASSTEDVLQQWDQYVYQNYSSRVIDLHWKRQELRPASVALATCDITLNNHDRLFTPNNTSSSLYPNVKTGRPLRLSAGFSGNNVRQFIGLTKGVPTVDEDSRTASFHAVDFLTQILQTPLRRTVVLIDNTIDQIIEYILNDIFGLSPEQYNLEESNINIPFFFAKKNEKFFDAAKQLVEAEIGSLHMDEQGMIVFRNRGAYSDTVVAEFSTADNVYDLTDRRHSDLINKITINSTIRRVEVGQIVTEITEEIELPPGNTDVWITFDDPVVALVAPTYSTGSSYMVVVNSEAVTVERIDLFGTDAKIVFNNPTGSTLRLINLVLYGDVSREQDPITVEMSLPASIEQYEEQEYTIESDYIGSIATAKTIGSLMLTQYGNYAGAARLEVRGSPQLQLGDVLELTRYGEVSLVRIVSIENTIDTDGFGQILHVVDVVDSPFFNYDSGYNYDEGNIYNL